MLARGWACALVTRHEGLLKSEEAPDLSRYTSRGHDRTRGGVGGDGGPDTRRGGRWGEDATWGREVGGGRSRRTTLRQ